MTLKSEVILSLEAPFRDSVEIHRLRFGDPSSGKHVAIVAGLHGNEVGGVCAVNQLVSQLGMRLTLPLHSPPVQQCVDLYRRLMNRKKSDSRLDEYAINQLIHHWCLSLRQLTLEPVTSFAVARNEHGRPASTLMK